MKKCSYCGRDNADEALNCRECGTEFDHPSDPVVTREANKTEVLLPGHLSETSGALKSIASLEVDLAVKLYKRLEKEGIPAEARAVTQEGGLDYRDIMVEENNYDRACDVAEAWEADRLAEAERLSNRHCPTCGSLHLEYTGADSFGISVWKCKDCGNIFAK